MDVRYQYIDEARAVGIWMVVMAHICGAAGLSNPVWDWFNPFMLGLFFMLSGYLHYAGRNRADSFPSFFVRRLKSLAVPYLFFSGTALLIQMAAVYEKHMPVAEIGRRLAVDVVTLKGMGPIWFLPVMFLAEIVFYFIIRGSKLIHGLALASAVFLAFRASGVLQMAGGNIPVGNIAALFVKAAAGTGVMILGYYVLPCMDRLKKRSALGITALCGLICSVAVARIYNLDLNDLDFGWFPPLFFLDSIFGTVCVVACCRLVDTVHPCGLLSYFGRNSLIILCTHTEWLLVPVITAGWAQVAGQAAVVGERYYAEILIKLAFVLAAETGVIELIHKYCPFIPGTALNRS